MKTWIVTLLAGRLGASWRTSILGVATIVFALAQAAMALCDNDPNTKFSWEVTSAAITAGVGLLMARDNKVSSIAAEAAKPGTILPPPVGIGNTAIGSNTYPETKP